MLSRVMLVLCLALLGAAQPAEPRIAYANYAAQFDEFEARTANMAVDARIAAFRAEFEKSVPGLYADRDQARLNHRIEKALAEFPTIRSAYRLVLERFPSDLASAVKNFRVSFPRFEPPMPIFVAHQLGLRDGGSDYVGGKKVMLFGADVIAKIHNDESLQPFLEHELFHLEHARRFADCDQLWCPLWQEGLATYAASVMTPKASDHQLLLDQPEMIRARVDARWRDALCWFADHFDSTDKTDADAAFTGSSALSGFPPRFGYYVGLRVAEQAGRARQLPTLAYLDDESARPIVARALASLIAAAHAPCRPPPGIAPISNRSSRPA